MEGTKSSNPYLYAMEMTKIAMEMDAGTGRRRKEYDATTENLPVITLESAVTTDAGGTGRHRKLEVVGIEPATNEAAVEKSDTPYVGRHRKESLRSRSSTRLKALGAAAVTAIGLFTVASPDTNENTLASRHAIEAERMDMLAPSSQKSEAKAEIKPTPTPGETTPANPEWETIPGVEGKVISEIELPEKTLNFLNNNTVDENARDPRVLGPLLYASEQTGVPVEALLALKYREIGPSLDPTTTLLDGEPLNKASGVSVDGHKIHRDPYDDALYGAKLFIQLAALVPEHKVDVAKPIDEVSPQDWGVAFLRYNRGTLYRKYGVPYTRSPYSMNGLSDEYTTMNWPGGDADPAPSTRYGQKDGNPVGAVAAMVYFNKLDLPKSVK